MAQAAALKGAANGKLRRLSARNKPPNCADFATWDSVLFYKTVGRKSAPRRRGPPGILGTEEKLGRQPNFKANPIMRQDTV